MDSDIVPLILFYYFKKTFNEIIILFIIFIENNYKK